jgi:hypothetical protein
VAIPSLEMYLLMRRSAALLLAVLLLAMAAVPAEAATVQRVFSAPMGTSGFNGLVKITAYTDGSGHVDYALKNLRKVATYRVEIRRQSCANLGSVVTAITPVKTGSLGKATLGRSISTANMSRIWQANWSTMLSVRLVSGTSIRCGNLVFPRASRVTVPAYSIDLPVVRAPSGYPYCNVAMYLGSLSQPKEPGVTFLMAHARAGMFLPLLRQWQLNKGVNMIGKKVYVYTTNSRLSTYQIYWVGTVLSVQGAVSVTAEQLWLQTSTGPHGTAAKLVVKAHRISTVAATYRASHPTPHIVHCGF